MSIAIVVRLIAKVPAVLWVTGNHTLSISVLILWERHAFLHSSQSSFTKVLLHALRYGALHETMEWIKDCFWCERALLQYLSSEQCLRAMHLNWLPHFTVAVRITAYYAHIIILLIDQIGYCRHRLNGRLKTRNLGAILVGKIVKITSGVERFGGVLAWSID